MAFGLKTEKKAMVLGALCEGSSIRSIERMTGVHRDTIMRLGVRAGQACEALHSDMMQGLECQTLQVDEIWGYVGKKQRHVRKGDNSEFGDAWTFVAIDADSKLVPAYLVGKRDSATANAFLSDLHSRLINRVQISTDGLSSYIDAIEQSFGMDVDYGQIVKTYAVSEAYPEGKYSPPEVVSVEKSYIMGNPDENKISTSYVERQNLTMRMHCRRLTRLTNAFSKKLDNFKAAIALHFAYYNLVKVHKTLRVTPAMAAGVTNKVWTVLDLLERID